MRLLLIEGDRRVADAAHRHLRAQGYVVDLARTAGQGIELASNASHDVIVLDLALPDVDGVSVCERLRDMGIEAPVLMLTPRAEAEHVVRGLDGGGDDVLARPFDLEVLGARVRALLRRGRAVAAAHGTRITREDVTLDVLRRRAERRERVVDLTPRQFGLLELLMRNSERVLSRACIAEHVWESTDEPRSNVIDACVSTLRKRIDHGFSEPRIHTVVGAGYRFGRP